MKLIGVILASLKLFKMLTLSYNLTTSLTNLPRVFEHCRVLEKERNDGNVLFVGIVGTLNTSGGREYG